ncbi:MAG: type II toxin-antitoxin system Phd/YefM family antitoxin [Pseudomonadota bacterium]
MHTLQDAKNRFYAVVEAALEGRPQAVSKRGKPAVVVISAAEYERLLEDSKAARGRFADHLLAFPGLETDRIEARPRDVDL